MAHQRAEETTSAGERLVTPRVAGRMRSALCVVVLLSLLAPASARAAAAAAAASSGGGASSDGGDGGSGGFAPLLDACESVFKRLVNDTRVNNTRA